tara:strand:+ start:392 stop:685 length:294 start_codon:yes stop_codon:yes gene_type:complete
MSKKKVKLYASDSVIEDFYETLAKNDPNSLYKVHIPKSDVFYVRKAIAERTGKTYSLDHVERAMFLEGHLRRDEVLDPDRPRGYCSYDTAKKVSTTQ